MMSVISSKGHPDGVMRVTWQKASAVEAQMAKVYAGLCDHYQKHGATTPPYRIAIDIHIYHLGSCTFAIE